LTGCAVNLDLALTKYFQLTERIRLQIRAKQPTFNHANFEIPDADISDVGIVGAIFGTVRAQLGQPAARVINLNASIAILVVHGAKSQMAKDTFR
jgi:hypothetical protein